MRKIYIGFSRNAEGKIFSRLLQDYMNKPYSHCFIEYKTKAHLGDDAIYHSSLSAGIGYASKTVFEEQNEIVGMYEVEVCDETYARIREELFKVCGRKYGLMQNLGIFAVDMLRNIGIKVKNPFVKDENCSEMVYRHALKVIKPELEYDPDTISPKEIEDILKLIGKRIL